MRQGESFRAGVGTLTGLQPSDSIEELHTRRLQNGMIRSHCIRFFASPSRGFSPSASRTSTRNGFGLVGIKPLSGLLCSGAWPTRISAQTGRRGCQVSSRPRMRHSFSPETPDAEEPQTGEPAAAPSFVAVPPPASRLSRKQRIAAAWTEVERVFGQKYVKWLRDGRMSDSLLLP